MLVEKNAALAKRILTSLSCDNSLVFKVACVNSAADATELIENTHIDIVLLDLSVTNDQTAQFVTKMLFRSPNIIIILLCSAADKANANKAMDSGAYDFIDKTRLGDNWIKRIIGYNLLLAKANKFELVSTKVLHAICDITTNGIIVTDRSGMIIFTNHVFNELTGLKQEQMLGTHWTQQFHLFDQSRLSKDWQDSLENAQEFSGNTSIYNNHSCRVIIAGSHIKSLEKSYGTIFTLANSNLISILPSQADTFIAASTAQMTLDGMSDAVISTDMNDRVMYLNAAAIKLTGWNSLEAVGRLLVDIVNLKEYSKTGTISNAVRFTYAKVQIKQKPKDNILVRKDGIETPIEESVVPILNELKDVIGAVLVFRDITKTQLMNLKMTHLAQHDFLTGLPNRLLFNERLNQSLVLAKRHKKLLAVLYLDIDLFKKINDIHGHEIGDKLLCAIANRMTDAVRDSDTVSRQGGDEFVLLLSEIAHSNDAAIFSSKLLKSLARPHLLNGKEIVVNMSIGISVFPNDDHLNSEKLSDALIDNADKAMFKAKLSGHNCYQFFEQSMHLSVSQQTQIQNRLKRALQQEEFLIYYQPRFNLANGGLVGAEALIRWQDPELGLLYPSDFLFVAIQARLIIAIGNWVRNQVCQQQIKWQEQGFSLVPLVVNIAAIELSGENFFANIQNLIKKTELEPGLLGLEVSEKDITEGTHLIFPQLKALGVKLGIDNFGAGAGNLSYLQCLDFDTVSIDPIIIQEAVLDPEKAKVAQAVIGLGKNLGQQIIGKNIENQQQVNFLKQNKCCLVQGYLFNKALSSKSFAQLLTKNHI